MREEEQDARGPSPEKTKGNARMRWFLLLVLALLAVFSSVLVGFLIGRNTDPHRGQILDTIVIGQDGGRAVHLAGQVRYADGTACADSVVELHSEPRMTRTDAQGRFFYDNVDLGEHTFSVLDAEGAVLASCGVTVSRGGAQPVEVALAGEDRYAVQLSAEVRFVELAIELRGDGEELKLIPKTAAALKDDGTLFADGNGIDAAKGVIVLPSGTVILTDGTVVASGWLVLPDNTAAPIPADGLEAGGGERVEAEGGVRLPDGTVISAGDIRLPDGEIVSSQTPYQIGAGGPAPEGGAQSRPGGQREPDGSPGGGSAGAPGSGLGPGPSGGGSSSSTSSSAGSSSSGSSSSGSSSSNTSSSAPAQTPVPPSSSSEPEDDGKGKLTAEQDAPGGWSPWESASEIDLFRDRTGTAENGDLQPGARGTYQFRLVNSRETDLTYTITVAESSFHLPMRFRLVLPDGAAGGWQTLQKGQALRLGGGTIGQEPAVLKIEWEWSYEGGDDSADTAAGAAQDRTYKVSLKIHAE
ncbi:carboxypeptidase regulatory-like domain-containing protein [Anaerofilum sp. BX8]|uniref:Carboxypeptidase regulatory-like domain-containing protein n=1 Tax=Anaerofilum hominis TaxID=2763016 RepID=A0A923ID33_9FIRM|nr:carboxypeptidase-like regulatory domain-containing protein [Anaerofilum hominis]MBC5579992.1 carboxypeptidase regulatory-like domain-containing protein [Anaerofilum hominis]